MFDRPNEVLPGVSVDTQDAIAKIETAIGTIPLALKSFWNLVGSVDLSGRHPNWQGCEYLDQLIVFPPEIALQELADYLYDRDEGLYETEPFLLPIAPDIYHKADVSGGPAYAIAVPAESDDPLVIHAEPANSLLDHIARALAYAGYPGLSDSVGHSWPVSELVADSSKL